VAGPPARPGAGPAARFRAVAVAAGEVEYPYSGADRPAGRKLEGMLWSDPDDEPPEELRDTQDMLRRLGILVALAMVVSMLVLGIM